MSQHSMAFKKFKKEMGQANHYLITIIVGLGAVKDGAEKKKEFSASWNPKNKKESADRSLVYAKKSSLAWAVDILDMYLRLCNRKPVLYDNLESDEIANTKQSVYRKYKCIVKNHKEIDNRLKAFVDLLICWRNKMIHFDADNKLQADSVEYFEKEALSDSILQKYHFDINMMMHRFNKGESPSFKEVSTMISMTIHFVEQVDTILMDRINHKNYIEEILMNYFKDNKKMLKIFDRTNSDDAKIEKKIFQLLLTEFGINKEFFDTESENYIKYISKMTESDYVNEYFQMG